MKTLARTTNEQAIDILRSVGFEVVADGILVRETSENTSRWFIPASRALRAAGIAHEDCVYAPRDFDDFEEIENIILIEDLAIYESAENRLDAREDIRLAIINAYYEALRASSTPQKTNAQNIRETIETHGKDTAFWNVFDAYAMVIGTDEWDHAVALLPEPLQEIAEKDGFDANLDWDYWPKSSFFGLSLTQHSRKEEELFSELYEDCAGAYRECLNMIEEKMMEIVRADKGYADFCHALKLAYSDAPEEFEEEGSE